MKSAAALLIAGLTSSFPAGRSADPPVASQFPSLEAAAESARSAWSIRDLDAFLRGAGPRLLVELPSADPSTPVGRAQAVALLQGYVQGTEEVETTVRKARSVEDTRGYVELTRHYRVAGLEEVREGVLLLGYRRGREGWLLTEVRAGI